MPRKEQEAREETTFWKDKYVKLAWLANQALMDIPKSLCGTKGITNLLNTPLQITQFLELCWGFYGQQDQSTGTTKSRTQGGNEPAKGTNGLDDPSPHPD
ncbi:hypothetical protein CR513_45089, partial [Mucuna pruriens]